MPQTKLSTSRQHKVFVRLNDLEMKKLEDIASSKGISISEAFRQLLDKA